MKKDNKEETQDRVLKRKLTGEVIGDKMDKTIVVRVDRVKVHKKYKKRYTVSKKYKAHDPKNQFKEGDTVTIAECRPISKSKTWRVVYNSK